MDPTGDDAGFTLLEVLIVLVILPLIIGAVAAAFIVSVKNDTIVSSRLSDSANAQIGDAYFSRDIKIATQVTTDGALAPGTGKSFSATAPEACASSSVLGSSAVPAGETLLVALYRPAQSPAPATDVAYWLEASSSVPNTPLKITRYSCTVSSVGVASNPVAVVISDIAVNPNNANLSASNNGIAASATISPSPIATQAASGWALSNPIDGFQGTSVTLGSTPVTLTVATDPSTSGFKLGTGVLTVVSSKGLQTVTCTGDPTGSKTFTGCTGGSGTVSQGASIHQASITSILASVSEPSSSYTYNLNGVPAGDASGTSNCLGTSCPTPGLLVLGGNGISMNGTGSNTCVYSGSKDKICVNGTVVLDGGTAACTGNANIGTSGTISDVNPGSTCDSGDVATTPFVPDPIAAGLPSPCFATAQDLGSPSSATTGTLTPGIYSNTITNAVLEPGVYVFEGGIQGAVTLATANTTDKYFYSPPTSTLGTYDPSAGVLIYLPGNGYPPGCINVTTPAGVTLSDHNGGNIAVSPIDASQSTYWFGNPYLADMWVWQDVTNTSQLSLSGNVTIASPGLAYLPGSTLVTGSGSESITTGRMIVGGVSLGGTPAISLTGS